MTLGAERSLAVVRASRFFTVAIVLGGGIGLALPFRQPPSVSRPPATPIPLELTLRTADVVLQASLATDRSPALDLERSSVSTSDTGVETATSHAASLRTTLENLAPPPDLPLTFQPRMDSPQQAFARAAPETSISPPINRAARPRLYRLRDGDTLESIAQRLLGDRDRAMEIFEANRQVLPRPDLLPVGISIVIPPRSLHSNAGESSMSPDGG